MSKEKLNELSKFLVDHQSELPDLFALEAADAVLKLAEMGYTVSEAELLEFGEFMNKAKANQESGELDEDSLEEVSGGMAISTALMLGVCIGYWIYNKTW